MPNVLNQMLCQVTCKYNQVMILIQQFRPIHFYSNSTDKNLAENFSLNSFLCGGGLKWKF